ncbi:response regulator [Bradyrhizobium symbiodeficiens]|uniref:response regulator n=1 Tax=Bradyrhizobium symbiodeficiens TaxID=1404367 RepID=UPI0030CDE040
MVILVVEDDFLIQDLVQGALSEGGFESEVASSAEEAVILLQGDENNYRRWSRTFIFKARSRDGTLRNAPENSIPICR